MKIKLYTIFILFCANICFAISITNRYKIERENLHDDVKRGVNGVIMDSKGTFNYVNNNYGETAYLATKNNWEYILFMD